MSEVPLFRRRLKVIRNMGPTTNLRTKRGEDAFKVGTRNNEEIHISSSKRVYTGRFRCEL